MWLSYSVTPIVHWQYLDKNSTMKKRSNRLPPLSQLLGMYGVGERLFKECGNDPLSTVITEQLLSALLHFSSCSRWQSEEHPLPMIKNMRLPVRRKQAKDERSISCFNTRSNKSVCSILLLQQHAIYIFVTPSLRNESATPDLHAASSWVKSLRNPICFQENRIHNLLHMGLTKLSKKIDNLKRHQNSVFVFHTSGSLIALFVPEISL